MDIVVLGLNHKTAPLEVREKVDFSKFPAERYLSKLVEQKSIESGLVLSTCNRVEVYVAGEGTHELLQDAGEFLRSFHAVRGEEAARFLYNKTNREAVKHLFRVASSLDSAIVGEPQILGQVKEAYYAANTLSLTSPFLDRLFQKAFSVAKRVRTETNVARDAVSVSYAAVELARKIYGELNNRTVLVLGAGEMAELAARHLHQQKLKEIYFSNRSYEHSVELAREFNGIPVPFEQFEKYMGVSDIVIVSTAAPHYLVKAEQVEKGLAARNQEPMFFIDISVPRNVDPKVDGIENAYLYNIDDLQQVVTENLEVRKEEALKAESIVDVEVERFFQQIERLEMAPVVAELQEKFANLTESELKRLRNRLHHLEDENFKEISRFAETLVRKMLNDPILFLKEGDEGSLAGRSELLAKIFAITKSKNTK